MAEKIFNARFAQKIDTLTAWGSSNIVLKAGEIAFATESVDTTVDGVTIKQPIILAKIGDGAKTFSQLPYSFYAKASDVHSWAKMSQEDFEAYLTTFIGQKVEDTDLDTRYDFEVIDEGDNKGKLAITTTLYTLGVAGTPSTTYIDIATQAELNKAIEDLTVTLSFTHDGTDRAATYVISQGGASVNEGVDIQVPDVDYVKEIDQAVKDEASRAAGAEEALAAKVTANETAITNETTRATGAEELLDERLTATEGVANSAKSAIDAFLNENAVSDDVVNTLKEIQEGLDAGEESAASLLAEINKLKDGTTPAGKATADANGNTIVDTYVTKTELNNKAAELIGNSGDFSSSDSEVKTITAAKEYTDYAVGQHIDAINPRVAIIENTLNTHGDIVTHNVSEFATAAQGAKADTAVQPEALHTVATSGKLSDLDATFGENVTDIIFDAGNASGYNA